MKSVYWSLVCGALILGVGAGVAVAFPPFKEAFDKKYVKEGSAELQAAFKEAGCNACHVKGEEKTERNAYAMELSKLLPGESAETKARLKDEKDKVLAELDAAFDKVGAMKPAGGAHTYAEIIKSGKLP